MENKTKQTRNERVSKIDWIGTHPYVTLGFIQPNGKEYVKMMNNDEGVFLTCIDELLEKELLVIRWVKFRQLLQWQQEFQLIGM